MQHQKHTKLARPHDGFFARNEWALIGTPCGNIQQLAQKLAIALLPLKIGYVDADHQETTSDLSVFDAEWTDKISFHRLDVRNKISGQAQKLLFNDMDCMLVNGNHFEARRQLVVLDPKKMESLSRKTNRLTAVDAFLTIAESPAVLPDFLKIHLPEWEKIPVFKMSDTEQIAHFLKDKIEVPPVNGLILVGGRSTRMGRDKSHIAWHGVEQYVFLQKLLKKEGILPYISCREEQKTDFEGLTITDKFLEMGPSGAILSAFREQPDAAWLVLACDMPFVTAEMLQFLLKNRNPSAVATAFRNSVEGFPEPLAAIWEPKAYLQLLQYMALGISCPRKLLINSNTHLLDAPDPKMLSNINTPDDMTQMQLGQP